MRLPLALFFALFLVGCSSEPFRELSPAPDHVPMQMYRFDRSLFAVGDTAGILALYHEWMQDHPSFTGVYLEEIMRMSEAESEMAPLLMLRFAGDTLWSGLQREVESVWPDPETEVARLNTAMARLQNAFPGKTLPQSLYFFNSGFNIAVYPRPEWIGIGLEWYIGHNKRWVRMLPPEQFPQYKKAKMNPENLVPDAVRGYLLHTFYTDDQFRRLLDAMVYYGKVMYTLKCLLPALSERDAIQYSPEQWVWAREYQYRIWKELIKDDVLFSENHRHKTTYTRDAPFTNGMGPESSPRLGWYMGLQMVKQYMASHGGTTLKEMMGLPPETILEGFNPKEL